MKEMGITSATENLSSWPSEIRSRIDDRPFDGNERLITLNFITPIRLNYNKEWQLTNKKK